MKVTTVRFGQDLSALLEGAAAANGVAVPRYIREAALARDDPQPAGAIRKQRPE